MPCKFCVFMAFLVSYKILLHLLNIQFYYKEYLLANKNQHVVMLQIDTFIYYTFYNNS